MGKKSRFRRLLFLPSLSIPPPLSLYTISHMKFIYLLLLLLLHSLELLLGLGLLL